jgi:hypothetical protein
MRKGGPEGPLPVSCGGVPPGQAFFRSLMSPAMMA